MLLLLILSFFSIISALQISSCIKYETYITTQYRMTPLEFPDSWFSHTFRYSPRVMTRMSLRSKRLLGCCESGYTYTGFPSYNCQPFCFGGCPLNAQCTEPNQCTCDYGYHKNVEGDLCLSNATKASENFNETTTAVVLMETTITSSTPKTPCNGSCLSNEICSLENDICICQNSYHRPNGTFNCIPKCDNGCQNADCTSPNTCTCWPHYEQTNDSSCHLKCTELSCTFGECNENGLCICAEGFFNNGTSCLWAGDDIFSEPDYCECWSKFIWQQNMTEIHCVHSCNDDVDNSANCISFNACEFYEGYTICYTNAQIYKCIDNIQALSTTTTVIPYMKADKATGNIENTSTEMPFLIVGFIILSLGIIGSLWIWNKRRNWFSQLWSYNPMENTQEEEHV